jgi:glutathione synthase/RimK-type ligase-like ATP-grasp enzyme
LTKPAEKTPPQSRLIPDNTTLRTEFNSLKAGDVFIGRLCLKSTEENLVVDLLERGVKLFPSGLAQLSCRSKVLQARMFAEYMVPGTRAIHNQHDLMESINEYHRLGFGQVVTKKDRANGGMGINLWSSVEEVFNQVSCGTMPFPFVLQPFYQNCRDIRVVSLDDYLEAYWRDNPNNFRNNLHCGASNESTTLTAAQLFLCREVMARGKFPYAHIDLMVSADGATSLAEINLRGGIKGARLGPREYQQKITAIHQRYCLEQGL